MGAREIRPTIGGIVRERAGRKLNTILIRTRDPDTYLHASERRTDSIDIHGPSRDNQMRGYSLKLLPSLLLVRSLTLGSLSPEVRGAVRQSR